MKHVDSRDVQIIICFYSNVSRALSTKMRWVEYLV